MPFDYDLDYSKLDLRKHPELYRVARGEQGVLLVEPYKSEILPYWRFKTPAIAKESADKLCELFEEYRKKLHQKCMGKVNNASEYAFSLLI